MKKINVSFLPSRTPATKCLIALSGRGLPKEYFNSFFRVLEADNYDCYTIVPDKFKWYPQPFSPFDQEEAVAGLPDAVNAVEKFIKGLRFKREDIVLCGFSAGGVVLMQHLFDCEPVSQYFCFSGAVLEPEKIPECKKVVPLFIEHAYNDNCFFYHERFIPMEEQLVNKNYKPEFHKNWQGHQLTYDTIDFMKEHLK